MGHAMLIEAEHRPDHYEFLISSGLLSQMRPGDDMIHPRDLAFSVLEQAFATELVAALKQKGRNRGVLVRGNHDSGSTSKYLCVGFDWVCDGFRLDYAGKRLYLAIGQNVAAAGT